MKFRLTRIAVVLLVLVSLPLAGWRLYLSHVINKELAAIRAAGQPVNGEELNRWYAAVPDQQNAALVLTQAFALLKTVNTISDERADEVFELRDKFPRRAALTVEHENLVRWFVITNAEAMAKAREALRLPACRYPIDFSKLLSTELPHLAHLANLAYLEQCAAALAELDGRDEEATQAILNILKLSRTLDGEPCLISQLVRFKLVAMAFATLERRANAGSLAGAELSALAEAFADLRATNIAAFAMIGDRAMTIPYFRLTRSEYARINPKKEGEERKADSPLPCHGPAVLRLIGYYELDFGTYLIGMRRAVTLLNQPAPDNLRSAVYFARVGEESTKRRRTLSGIALSSYGGSVYRENKALAEQRLALAALAIEKYRNKTGKLPETLEELVPKFVDELPEDPFTGSDLEYRHTEKGYLIYSVGPDRKDDAGLEETDKQLSQDQESYDITFVVER